jgi:NAD(P)H-flavin reductase
MTSSIETSSSEWTGDDLRVVHTLTRSQPSGWTGYARRVDAGMLAEIGPEPAEQPRVYICGPTSFVYSHEFAAVQHRASIEAGLTNAFGGILV